MANYMAMVISMSIVQDEFSLIIRFYQDTFLFRVILTSEWAHLISTPGGSDFMPVQSWDFRAKKNVKNIGICMRK